ncbi:TPR domain protein [Limnospira platensis NIES-39]|uniref:TPR domain protein n=2 Tax=Limnospira platensis TaxID=118562 RepID=A0A5M3T4M6_LIMPL|nr:TPR domain protein [Arthrospira platensis NIES-39]BDT10293.1 TPR domain protein [Arthrospira platensis NIES-39]GCE92479.1 TPR domain protein [Arthrospira platensis NIES-46]
MSAGELLRQANQLKRSGKLDEAIALYHQAIELNPSFAWTYYELGDALVKFGRREEGIVQYNNAVNLDPNSAFFKQNLMQIKNDRKIENNNSLDLISTHFSLKKHHIIISGTGRSGTTFLVQLLTDIGLDTGFQDTNSHVFKNCNAGMEKDIRSKDAPYIIKSPWLCDYIDQILESKKYVIDCAYIPIRDLFSASASRIYVNQNSDNRHKHPPGGLWHTHEPSMQECLLSRQLYKLIYQLVKHDINCVYLFFPRFIYDPEYLYRKLEFVLKNVNYNDFLCAFNKTVKPELVHQFEWNLQKTAIQAKSMIQ